MKKNLKKLPQNQVELNIELEIEEFKNFFKKAAFRLSREIKVAGFRKGNVPEKIALEKIGLENVLMEAARFAIQETSLKVILENNLEVISQPKIEILKLAPENPFSFRAVFLVLPEITLPDYKKICSGIKKKKIILEDSEIEQALTWLQKSRSRLEKTNKKAKKGDFVEIEFSAAEIENGKIQKDTFLLGQGHSIKKFEENIEGMRQGEEKKFSVSFPENHFQKEIAGKEIIFSLKMITVSELIPPEINDEFAKGLGNFEDINQLKESIKGGIKSEKDFTESQRVREEILKKIESKCRFEIPKILIENEKKQMMNILKQKVSKDFNISFEDYLRKVKKTEKELLDSFTTEAAMKIRRTLILKEVSKKENIEVSGKEITEEVNKILRQYPDVGTVKKKVDLERLKSYTEEMIRTEKTLKRLESFI